MENANYEEVLRRRQERRRRERKRRRRKVMMMYMVILALLLASTIFAVTFWKNKRKQNDNAQDIVSTSESQSSSEAVEAVSQNEEASSSGSTKADTPDNPENSEDASQAASLEKQPNIFQRFFAWVRGLFNRKDSKASAKNGQAEPNLPGEDEQNTLSDDNLESSSDLPDASLSGEEQTNEDIPQVPDINTPEGRLANLLFLAEQTALGYDYDKAIALLQSSEEFSANAEALEAIGRYETAKASLVEYNIKEITHVFFHSLVMDNAKAFDGDSDAKGYNQVMTTKNEFLQILQEMYNRGYVLVRLHDIAHEETDENGNVRMVKGKIMLPEGKKAFVMSQDDVCYYPYMSDDGFAKRIIIGEDGKPTCVMELDDGTEVVGSYDLIPLLEDFIQAHPDFSYKGARAVIAFTGYEGILGYRTAASYQEKNVNYEADCQQAAAVAQCLRDNGWELASHSWGHRYLGQIEYEKFVTDTNKWEAEVESLIGPTDIILFPFGDDVGDWHPYTSENKRFTYLYSVGFRYFCNVDSTQYWVQLGDTFLRQGRRNLDGFRMWKDIEAGQESRTEDRKLDDLFRAEDVFDPARPTPVEWE